MKRKLSNLFSKSAVLAFALAALLALSSPTAVFARGEHGGAGHSGGGQRFNGGGGFRGGGQQFRGGGGSLREGNRSWGGGRDYHREGRDWDHRGRYYGGGWGGYFGAPYYGGFAYGPGYCTDGYYDNWGYWHPYPGCYAPGY